MKRALLLCMAILVVATGPVGTVAHAANVLVDAPSLGTPLPAEGVGPTGLYDSRQAVSANGRFAVFSSQSDGLLASDENTATNVYRKDLLTGDLVLVSTGTSPTANAYADQATISGDGTKVAFRTAAALEPADTNEALDVYVRTITSADGAGTTALASCAITGPCDGLALGVQDIAMSADGGTVVWTTPAALAAGDTDGSFDAYARTGGTTFAVSVGDDETFASGFVTSVAVDADGGRIAFSTTDELDADTGFDNNDAEDVYVRDVTAGATHLVSRSVVIGPPAAVGGREPDIADGGVRVAYSTAAGLAAGNADTNGQGDVYSAVVGAGSNDPPSLVSAADGSSTAAGGGSPAISGNGTRVAFLASTAVAQGVPAGRQRVYLRTLGGTATALVSRADGAGGAPAASDAGAASLDVAGERIAFSGADGGLTADTGVGADAVYLRDVPVGTTTAVSRPPGTEPFLPGAGNAQVGSATVTSADDRFVVFDSSGVLAPPAGPDGVYRRDLLTGATVRVDVAPDGSAPDDRGFAGSISDDGSRVAFTSTATNLVDGDTNNRPDAFVRDLAAGITTRISLSTTGAELATGSTRSQISGDGTRVLFDTVGPADPVRDTNTSFDNYVATPDGVELASAADGASGAAVGATSGSALSRDGKRVAFQTSSDAIGNGDTNNSGDAHVRDLPSESTMWASRSAAGTSNGQVVSGLAISDDGSRVAFVSNASDFADGDTDTAIDVHVRDLGSEALTWATRGPGEVGAPLANGWSGFALAPDASKVAFSTEDALADGDTNGEPEPYVRVLATGATSRPLARADGSQLQSSMLQTAFSGSSGCLLSSTNETGLVASGYTSTDFEHAYLTPLGDACRPAQPSPSPSPSPAPTAAPADTTAPALGRLRLTAKRFRVAKARSKAGRRAPLGTKLRGTLSEDARLTLTLQRETKGRRVRSKCRPPSQANRRRPGCTRRKTIKVVRARRSAGAFSVKLKPKGAKRGRYRLRVTAADAAGNRSKTAALKLRIVR